MGDTIITKDFVGYKKNNNGNNLYNKPPTPKDKKRKGRGPMNIIKVVLYMMRGKGGKTGNKMSSCLPSATNATLNSLVGSFRPLHLQSGVGDMSPPPPPQPAPLPPFDSGMAGEVTVSPNEKFEVSPPPHHSKSASSLSSSSSEGDLSRYASAQSLYDLDNHDDDDDDAVEEEDDGDAYYDGLEGDEMIDAKAEMFIAKFYQQMRLQENI